MKRWVIELIITSILEAYERWLHRDDEPTDRNPA